MRNFERELIRRSALATIVFGTSLGATTARAQTCLRERPTDVESTWSFDSTLDDVQSYAPVDSAFRIWYAISGPHAPADLVSDGGGVPESVRLVEAIASEAATFYENVLGYRAAIGDGDYDPCASNGGDESIDIYLYNFSSADGTARVERCVDGLGCSGFIIIENDFVEARYSDFEQAVRTVVPHEYFHLVQAAYRVPIGAWWAEGTAQWAANELSPELTDLESYLPVFFSNVDRPIDLPPATAAQPFSYGAAILPVFLAETHGRDVIRRIFEGLGDPAYEELEAFDVALDDVDSSLALSFSEFAKWNAATGERSGSEGYLAAGEYPEVALEVSPAADGSFLIAGSLAGLSANYFLVEGAGTLAFDFHGDEERTAAFAIPLRGRVAELAESVALGTMLPTNPSEVEAPAVIVVSGQSGDKRDATYEIDVTRRTGVGTASDATSTDGVKVLPEGQGVCAVSSLRSTRSSMALMLVAVGAAGILRQGRCIQRVRPTPRI